MHAVRLLGPAGKFVFVGFELFLEGAQGGGAFVEEDLGGGEELEGVGWEGEDAYCSVASSEPIHSPLCMLKFVFR